MKWTSRYESPLGAVFLEADQRGLTGLWFEGQLRFGLSPQGIPDKGDHPVLCRTRKWLDAYFSGKNPDIDFPVHLIGTEFQRQVWSLLSAIPYGETVTYGMLADKLAAQRGVERISAQAVGGAVGRNRISVVIPCHRVMGAKGKLTGYAGGLERKVSLLRLEGVDTSAFSPRFDCL